MRTVVRITLFLFFLINTRPLIASEDLPDNLELESVLSQPKDKEFAGKLKTMLERIEKSVKILRDQITQNQSAPYLANLYLQLGDLISQKSTVLYYIQMENDNNTDLSTKETKKFSPVVQTQQEAVSIYRQILKEFPKFDKNDKVLYRLAISLKSIDEKAAFVDVCEKLVSQYPSSKESVQAHLLLGQHFYDDNQHSQAVVHFNKIIGTEYPFERNSAKYRIGLIRILEEKHAEALKYFEQVALDPDLKEEDNPTEISLKKKVSKNNIKREALIDSVRAFTQVYKVNPDPVPYYARLAPTELLFQETIEKLAYRYIFLKEYNNAVKLLRTLSERTSDPQKIMSIYHEVLLIIPIKDRIDIPVSEIQFVLEKYNFWASHYNLPGSLKNNTYDFFETQVRELGTRSHDLAKIEKDADKKRMYLSRARGFYQLYLGFFEKGTNSVKMAMNLADVYFLESNHLESGSYYLRIYQGEFGTPTSKDALLQNSILALQKPSDYGFYDQLRAKGLLVKAIRTYQAFDKSKAKDPSLNFSLAKTLFEQGYYDQAFSDLLNFIKNYPQAREVESAADLILYYFNTKNDFTGLVEWSQKMLNLNPPNKDLRKRLIDVKSKALLKKLDEKVKLQKGYDAFSQGKSYLQAALNVGDASLRSAAFEQALGRSKAEKDISTFLKTAFAMAKSEKPNKRADLLNSMADETLAIARYSTTRKIWSMIQSDSSLPKVERQKALEKNIKLTLMLRDYHTLTSQLQESIRFQNLTKENKESIQQQLNLALESAIQVPDFLIDWATKNAKTDDDFLALFKVSYNSPKNFKSIQNSIKKYCVNGTQGSVCKWFYLNALIEKIGKFKGLCLNSPATLNSVEPVGKEMAVLLNEEKRYEGSGDATLDIILSSAIADIYEAFALFLNRTIKVIGGQNVELSNILSAKIKETQESSKKSREECRKIIVAAQLISPVNNFCVNQKSPLVSQALTWSKAISLPNIGNDSSTSSEVEYEKQLFVKRSDWKLYFDLGEKLLNEKLNSRAAASAVYGMSAFPQNKEEFEAILGCAVLNMGLKREAQYHLSKASSLNGLKELCLNKIKNEVGIR